MLVTKYRLIKKSSIALICYSFTDVKLSPLMRNEDDNNVLQRKYIVWKKEFERFFQNKNLAKEMVGWLLSELLGQDVDRENVIYNMRTNDPKSTGRKVLAALRAVIANNPKDPNDLY